MKCPGRLRKGDKISIVAPASPVNWNDLMVAKRFYQALGLTVVYGQHILQKDHYLAGSDDNRLADLHAMFLDPQVKAVFCARGGYGTGRLVDRIDYDCIKANPKIFWGYSDMTYLHIALQQKAGLVTFHGPMGASDISDASFDQLSAHMFNQLFHPYCINYTEALSSLTVIAQGESTGQLIGGNLTLLVETLGTPDEIATDGKIMLIEEIDEQPYRIDAMLNHLRLAGKLTHLAGIVIGHFKMAKQDDCSLTHEVTRIFQHYFSQLNCPVMAGFNIGHGFPNIAIPLGVEARLSTYQRTLAINPGVG